VTQPVDKSILQEIVRIIEAQRKVPEKVVVRSREYVITYLEDHMNRLQEALRRYDSDRLNMLYGQLASKVKYQMQRIVAGRAKVAEKSPEAAETAPAKGKKAPAKVPAEKVAAMAAAKAAAKKVVKAAAKKAAKPAAKKAATKKSAAKKAPARKAPAAKKAPAKAAKKTAAKKTSRAAAKSHK